ncbi:hypothetical protein [Agromyces cerinus]|uniref:Uncharacterized protein n=1 Tax=Agromyces cerinus subsp. cerinus TaxID=232089 RepID=A0A1N6HJR0_9MICO|nr:hypothetical protein [Agromyces cerinus]SIO19982.1 hypothetical protein SAMN05443544_3246 [Agromyces cerinus subsp. cerinus]
MTSTEPDASPVALASISTLGRAESRLGPLEFVLRFSNPLQSFFDKSWRPSEIEPV